MFDENLLRQAKVRVNEAQRNAYWLWFHYALLGLFILSLIVVAVFEADLLYTTFDKIAGQHPSWSPILMSFSGLIMLWAFHTLCRLNHEHPMIKLVHKVTPYIISLYLAGLGLLTSGLVSVEAGAALLQIAPPIVIGVLPEVTEPAQMHWLLELMQGLTNPLALIVLSLGVGGIAIVNLFVAHDLVVRIDNTLRLVKQRHAKAQRLIKADKILKSALEYDIELELTEAALAEEWTQSKLNQNAALQISQLIQSALLPHKGFVKRRRILPASIPIEINKPVDPNLIAGEIKKIESLDHKTLIRLFESELKESQS